MQKWCFPTRRANLQVFTPGEAPGIWGGAYNAILSQKVPTALPAVARCGFSLVIPRGSIRSGAAVKRVHHDQIGVAFDGRRL